MMTFKDVKIEIIEKGFTDTFPKIHKYMIDNKPLSIKQYILLFDLALTYKQARIIFNQIKDVESYNIERSFAIRLLWKEITSVKHMQEAINFYKNTFSEHISSERLHNSAMIYYEKKIQQQRLNEIKREQQQTNEAQIEFSPMKTLGKRKQVIFVYPRSEKVKLQALEKSGYLCAVNKEHKNFISRATNENYVEVHHLIPFSQQGNYRNSLDCIENIVCLCVSCHKQLHLARFTDKKFSIELLFNLKLEELRSVGLNITLQKLYEIYCDENIEEEDWDYGVNDK
ncbi:HNH endonuclease signature motif containing protein [Sporosarcina sp.]|uniref:HNH endonuclease n=1 Tax=Sporosarcina sp. TaxID=49982 RepID=UPI0026393D70|nr:HNH endonuclease signature motif containing protein [Sporosarcina sp.]